jgi:hypothetical protein
VFAPNLIGIIDVIAIPRLALFFGTRLLHFGACAAAKAGHEKSKRADNFQAGEYVFHIFLVPDALKALSVPRASKIYKFLLPDKLWISGHEMDQDEMLDVQAIVPSSVSSHADQGKRIGASAFEKRLNIVKTLLVTIAVSKSSFTSPDSHTPIRRPADTLSQLPD